MSKTAQADPKSSGVIRRDLLPADRKHPPFVVDGKDPATDPALSVEAQEMWRAEQERAIARGE